MVNVFRRFNYPCTGSFATAMTPGKKYQSLAGTPRRTLAAFISFVPDFTYDLYDVMWSKSPIDGLSFWAAKVHVYPKDPYIMPNNETILVNNI